MLPTAIAMYMSRREEASFTCGRNRIEICPEGVDADRNGCRVNNGGEKDCNRRAFEKAAHAEIRIDAARERESCEREFCHHLEARDAASKHLGHSNILAIWALVGRACGGLSKELKEVL